MPETLWTVFATAALRSPHTVGAIAPSSPRLAARLAAVVPTHGEPTVVELGPGTGAITTAISARLGVRGRHLALESDPHLLAHLRRRHPHVEAHHGDAAQLSGLLSREAIPTVDAMVSSLPWTLFAPAVRARILEQVTGALDPHGVFTTFAYLHALALPPAVGFRRLLTASFDEVLPTRTIWANLPPAITYVCRYPRTARDIPGTDLG